MSISSFLLYAVVPLAGVWVALLWVWPRKTNVRAITTWAKTIAGAITVLLLFVPISGVPLWNRAFSFYPNPSLPMLGIVCAALWHRLFALQVFHRRDWDAIWMFGALAGSALYLQPMLLGAFDLYYWGWDRGVAACVIGALAIAFLGRGSRLGVLLVAALLSFAIGALESENGWDYVMDPFYWLMSVAVLGFRFAANASRRSPTQAAFAGHSASAVVSTKAVVPVAVHESITPPVNALEQRPRT